MSGTCATGRSSLAARTSRDRINSALVRSSTVALIAGSTISSRRWANRAWKASEANTLLIHPGVYPKVAAISPCEMQGFWMIKSMKASWV